MTRALTIVAIAVLIAAVSGVNDASLALASQTRPANDERQREILSRANKIGVNRVVRIERVDGTKSNALLEDVAADAITVVLLDDPTRRRETIPISEIKKIDEVRGHALRNILIGVGIGAAVLVGACAIAANSLEDLRP